MEEDIVKLKADVFDLQTSNDAKSKEVPILKDKVSAHQNHLARIDNQINAQEQYSRRNCIRVFGCTERNGENTDKIIMDIANNILKVDLRLEDIDRSHRVGKRKEKDGKQIPRGIIVKLKTYRKRQEILRNRRKLKGHNKSIVEDLTTRNQELLNYAKACPTVQNAWSSDGRIIVMFKDKNAGTKVIHSKDQLG